jgi:hypothetical protein
VAGSCASADPSSRHGYHVIQRSNDRYLCGQPIKRAADAQKMERRLQVFVRLQTSIRALLILASQSPFSFAEPTCSSATEEFFS